MLATLLRSFAFSGFLFVSLSATFAGAHACDSKIRITYSEDSPDAFLVEFKDKERSQIASLRIDLRASVGRAFIDTAYVQDQPSGSKGVILGQGVGFVDGSRDWTLTFKRFLPGQTFRLLVDLDDAAVFGSGDPDHLTDGELQDAKAQARLIGPAGKSQMISGVFDRNGVATLGQDACV